MSIKDTLEQIEKLSGEALAQWYDERFDPLATAACHLKSFAARPDDHGECCKHSESDHYEHRFDDWNDGCSKCADRHGFIPYSARPDDEKPEFLGKCPECGNNGSHSVYCSVPSTHELIHSLQSQLAAERTRREDGFPPIELCGCGKPTQYSVGADANKHPVFACNKYFRCPTYAETSRMLIDARLRLQEYERMISQAYSIDFTDWERTIDKSGSYESSTGIIWTVKDDESEVVLSRHETALDAYRAITQAPGDTSEDGAGPEVNDTKRINASKGE